MYEPFNVDYLSGWMPTPVDRWFLHITDRNATEYSATAEQLHRAIELRYPVFRAAGRARTPAQMRLYGQAVAQSTIGRIRRSRALLKDPIALLSAPWIAGRFDADVLVTARHPAAFALSLMERGWTFDFNHLSEQADLLSRCLAGMADEIQAAAHTPPSFARQAGLLWKALYTFVQSELAPRPDTVIARHEDIVKSPSASFERLSTRFDFVIGRRLRRRMSSLEAAAASGATSQFTDRWRTELGPDQLAELRDAVGDSATWLYPDAWGTGSDR